MFSGFSSLTVTPALGLDIFFFTHEEWWKSLILKIYLSKLGKLLKLASPSWYSHLPSPDGPLSHSTFFSNFFLENCNFSLQNSALLLMTCDFDQIFPLALTHPSGVSGWSAMMPWKIRLFFLFCSKSYLQQEIFTFKEICSKYLYLRKSVQNI